MIIIVGAGPAGLATAYELQQRGLPYQVLERQTIGYSWRNHYDRLRLHTLKDVSALPGLPMPANYPDFPTAEQVWRYLEHYANHFQLQVTTGVDVHHAAWNGNTWTLETSHGPWQCEVLMATTGIWSNPHQPVFEGQDSFQGTIMHSRDYRNAAQFRGQRVLVVGPGNSGTEIAVDLSDDNISTGIAVRGGVRFVPYPGSATEMNVGSWLLEALPRSITSSFMSTIVRDFSHLGLPLPDKPLVDVYPVVGYELPEAVEAGRVNVHRGLKRFVNGRPQFDDGEEAEYDAVILATGFRPALQFIEHELEFSQHCRPRLDRFHRSIHNRNLFCIGYTYPATSGWLQVIGRVVREAASAFR
jgi:cation diffusion facilitator CzcD-associated flavoprotein CzcO